MALFIWDWDAQYGESGPEGLRSGSGDTEQGSNWNEDRDVEDRGTDVFVFTASRPEDAQSQEYDANDLDRHVSLEVQLEGFYHGICHNGSYGQIPKLRIKRWLPGMCFFKGCPRLPVIFPWPSNLKVIGLCLNKG
ncbi:hypothetical protein S7711_09656 [Stachybotrys chartarum IBT 7711]|uniref:Uncharacterized protein n=1 Tax=Stachybotrys chartarum (strain CBS 109288 / IBT 7711) TaxID=1280523 RepID=A0A084BBX0_STACB|nr:hypothetical protein S7711_09656 [Stachybotrys chartarum IBT 7711]